MTFYKGNRAKASKFRLTPLTRIVFWFPILFFGVLWSIKIYNNSRYMQLIQEDAFLEHFQVFAYLFAFIFGIIVTLRFFRQKEYLLFGLFLVFSIAMIFTSLEEMIWGQRIFEISSPQYFHDNNRQAEITIHNLEPVQGILHELYIIIGFFGAFGWYILSKLPEKYQLGKLAYIIPPKYLSPYFFFAFLIYLLLEWLLPLFEYEFGWTSMERGKFFVWRDQEPAELLLSMGFLFFAIGLWFRQSQESLVSKNG